MKKILIFDDDRDILEVCTYILMQSGYDVHIREKCDDVIQVMKEIRPSLVLMDNWIPDIGGIEATRRIKGHPEFANTPIVYFSANSQIQTLANQAGADGFIAKPFELNEFEHLISTYFKD